MIPKNEQVFLGFDFSTQQLKSVIINSRQEVQHEALVQFDVELPEFRTHNGVIKGEKKTVTAPTLMWVKALDMVLEKLRVCGADFSKVVALSGSAQQHGTVYWANGSEETLGSLSPDHFMHTQLASCFSIMNSPVWMDSSTTQYCRAIEEAVGGAIELAKVTGSKAYERYSASQISKIADTKPNAYKNTERISLISSFACSLFLGKYAPIDYADGSGMNLLDIATKTWSTACLQATAEDLEGKLGVPVPSSTILGEVSNYFVERFAFNEECKVVAFTGDNPSSLAGLSLSEGDMAVSLGTSDTLFMWLKEPRAMHEGHILINPMNEHEYMGLLCYKNGSLVRERIKDSLGQGSWEEFNRLLNSTPRGNFGYLGFYYDLEEIANPLQGCFKYDKANNSVEKFPSPEVEVRAVVEGQFLAKKAVLDDLNVTLGSQSKIVATGGASKNDEILQVISDIFNVPVYQNAESANSAMLGAAYRALDALNADKSGSNDSDGYKSHALQPKCFPFSDSKNTYDPLIKRCREIHEKLVASTK